MSGATLSTTLGFLGCGNMAEAIVRGVLGKKLLTQADIVLTDVSADRRTYLRSQFSAAVLSGAAQVLSDAKVIIVAVKPQNIPELLAELRGQAKPEHLFLSICAGVTTETFETALRHDGCPHPRVVRVMPNTPALIGQGVAGIAPGADAQEADLEIAERIFSSIGSAYQVGEEMMDAVTALTGSGPAYVFYLIEALIDGAQKIGFEESIAQRMATEMVAGAARLAVESEKSASELRRMVTSPGGTTAAGIAVLDAANTKQIFEQCLIAARDRGAELSEAAMQEKQSTI